MRKLLLFVFAVNLILLASIGAQTYIYKYLLVPRLIWALDTVHLDFIAQRNIALSCKKQMVPM